MWGTTTTTAAVGDGTVRNVIEWARERLTGAARWVILTVAGGLLVAAGIVMIFTPGPGWGAIALGLYLWAKQFKWARRVLDRLVDWLDSHRHRLPKFVGRLIDERRRRSQAARVPDEVRS